MPDALCCLVLCAVCACCVSVCLCVCGCVCYVYVGVFIEWPWEGMGVRGRVECARWYCRLGQTDDARKVAADLGTYKYVYIYTYIRYVYVYILELRCRFCLVPSPAHQLYMYFCTWLPALFVSLFHLVTHLYMYACVVQV
jgi:hypothetical protein